MGRNAGWLAGSSVVTNRVDVVVLAEAKNDGFGHTVLGGTGETLKRMILEAGIVPRAKVQDVSTAARSSYFAQSLVNVIEAYELGMSAHARSV